MRMNLGAPQCTSTTNSNSLVKWLAMHCMVCLDFRATQKSQNPLCQNQILFLCSSHLEVIGSDIDFRQKRSAENQYPTYIGSATLCHPKWTVEKSYWSAKYFGHLSFGVSSKHTPDIYSFTFLKAWQLYQTSTVFLPALLAFQNYCLLHHG